MNVAPESESAGRAAAAAHDRSVAVWAVPPAIECSSRFSIHVGVKCPAACRADGWRVEIRDQDDRLLATATLGDEPWTGTTALYHAEVELAAPAAEGLYVWQAIALASGHDTAAAARGSRRGPADDKDDDGLHSQQAARRVTGHDESRERFTVRAVPVPDCRVTVVATDRERRTPIAGAKICAHPYRARTDTRGIAQVRLPKGQYRLFVSGRDYFTLRRDLDVAEDVTIDAELEPDRGLSDADLWS